MSQDLYFATLFLEEHKVGKHLVSEWGQYFASTWDLFWITFLAMNVNLLGSTKTPNSMTSTEISQKYAANTAKDNSLKFASNIPGSRETSIKLGRHFQSPK